MNFCNLLLIWMLWMVPQQAPSFKGGQKAFGKFISQNVVYPEYSLNNCLSGQVWVSFKLDKEGNVYQAHVDKGLGLDLDDEALRIIKLSSGKWEGGQSATRYLMPISFELNNADCRGRSREEINSAIDYYRTQSNLESTVFNYYKNLREGKANTKDRSKIESLKEQLGFDEDFINRQMGRARQMLRQGDKEGACKTLQTIKDIGSDKADKLIAENCAD